LKIIRTFKENNFFSVIYGLYIHLLLEVEEEISQRKTEEQLTII